MNARNLSALLALLVVVSLAPMAGAQAGFEISASDTTPVPERTVTVGGDSFTFDSMIRADEGDTVTVDVTAPNDDNYRLELRNKDNQVDAQRPGTGDESFTFDLSDYEYGSYAFAVYQDRSFEKVQPLLVSGYDVAVDAPDSVSSDGSADVTVDVTETAASSDPANVQVIVAQGDTTQEFDASGGDGEYTATIDGGALDEGDYTVYAVAQGDEEAFGRSELLGLSDGHSLAVESGTNGGDGGSGGDGTDGSESTDETETTEGNGTDGTESDESGSSDGGDSTGGGDGAANPPANESTDTETTTAPPTTTVAVTETATDDGVVTPADDTETETETGTTGLVGPGFTVAGALVAVALVALLGRRRL